MAYDPAPAVTPTMVPEMFAELPIGAVFTFDHDVEGVRYRKIGLREYQLAEPVVKRIGARTAPVTQVDETAVRDGN